MLGWWVLEVNAARSQWRYGEGIHGSGGKHEVSQAIVAQSRCLEPLRDIIPLEPMHERRSWLWRAVGTGQVLRLLRVGGKWQDDRGKTSKASCFEEQGTQSSGICSPHRSPFLECRLSSVTGKSTSVERSAGLPLKALSQYQAVN
jgi:hypothetical protein